MKRPLMIFSVAIASLFLASCYRMAIEPIGTIRFNLGAPTGRAISSTANVRVYLYTYSSTNSYSLFTFPSGKTYTEFSYGSGTQSITGIPVGLWQVLVSVGSDGPSGTDAFYTSDYGASPVINVVAGVDTSTSIQTVGSDVQYSPDLAGVDLTGVYGDPFYSSYVFASSRDMLYFSIPPYDTSNNNAPSMPTTMPEAPNASQITSAGLQIESIDGGYTLTASGTSNVLFVNTNKGIVTYDELNTQTFDATFSQNLVDGSGNTYAVAKSGAVGVVGAASDEGVFYIRSDGFGGVFLTPSALTPSTTKWIDVPVSGKSSGPSVFDLALDGDGTATPYAYFATAIGAFRTDMSLIQSTSTASQSLAPYAHFFTAPDNSVIESLGIANGQLFIGTSTGAYYGLLQESNLTQPPVTNWNTLDDSSGAKVIDSIVQIATTTYTDYNSQQQTLVAFRSKYNIYVLNATSGQVSTYPFYSGLPGDLHAMSWFGSTLFVAGSEGLVCIEVGPAFAAYG